MKGERIKRFSIVEHHSSASSNMWFEIEESEDGKYVEYNGLENEIFKAIADELNVASADRDIVYGKIETALRKMFRR